MLSNKPVGRKRCECIIWAALAAVNPFLGQPANIWKRPLVLILHSHFNITEVGRKPASSGCRRWLVFFLTPVTVLTTPRQAAERLKEPWRSSGGLGKRGKGRRSASLGMIQCLVGSLFPAVPKIHPSGSKSVTSLQDSCCPRKDQSLQNRGTLGWAWKEVLGQ